MAALRLLATGARVTPPVTDPTAEIRAWWEGFSGSDRLPLRQTGQTAVLLTRCEHHEAFAAVCRDIAVTQLHTVTLERLRYALMRLDDAEGRGMTGDASAPVGNTDA